VPMGKSTKQPMELARSDAKPAAFHTTHVGGGPCTSQSYGHDHGVAEVRGLQGSSSMWQYSDKANTYTASL
jgi:hypothetical protein